MSLIKEQLEKMTASLRRGKEIHDQFANIVRTQVLIQGRTMEAWRAYFEIDLPDNPDVIDCKTIDMKLMQLHQEASFLKCMAEASSTLGKKSFDTQYREKFTALVSEYKSSDKKLPAKETLETLVSQELDDIDTSLSYSDLAVKFWKDVIEDLNFKRKAIENITMQIATEAKANAASNFLQNRRDV